jgi:glycine cleavage system H lipoate-binding protein
MFPWIDGFRWTANHIIFLSLFFAVVLTIVTTFLSALYRTADDFHSHRAAELCWKSDFAELPPAERHCRHELAGRVGERTCNNAFDCRHCAEYPRFASLPAGEKTNNLGIPYAEDRFYHRGHTWVKPEDDGTVTIGLDELAEHLIGDPDSVDLPAPGSEIEMNQTAWRIKKNRKQMQVRAPIEGTVLEVGGPKQGWYLKVRPRLNLRDPATLRHLLRGPEVHGWLARELERLQLQLHTPDTKPSLADGGTLMPGLMDAMPEADWDTALADTFLEA